MDTLADAAITFEAAEATASEGALLAAGSKRPHATRASQAASDEARGAAVAAGAAAATGSSAGLIRRIMSTLKEKAADVAGLAARASQGLIRAQEKEEAAKQLVLVLHRQMELRWHCRRRRGAHRKGTFFGCIAAHSPINTPCKHSCHATLLPRCCQVLNPETLAGAIALEYHFCHSGFLPTDILCLFPPPHPGLPTPIVLALPTRARPRGKTRASLTSLGAPSGSIC